MTAVSSKRGTAPGLRIAVAVNVRAPVLRAYLMPLAALPEVDEVIVIRDRADIPPAPKFRVVVPPPWWPSGLPWKILARRMLFWWVGRTRRPDAGMVVHWFPDGPAVGRWTRRLGVPLVAHIIGGAAELKEGGRWMALSRLPSLVRRWAERYQRRALSRANVVTVTGTTTRDWYAQAGVPASRVVVLHAVIDFPPAEVGPGGRDLDVVFIGRADADKRVDRCLRVIHAVLAKRPGLTVTIIGVEEAEVAGWASYHDVKSRMGGNLVFQRHVTRVADTLRRAKVLLVTSDTEGRTLAVLEAAVCGAAVVATAVGDLDEVIAGGGGGISVPLDRDETALTGRLADGVVRLIEDEVARAAMAAAGRGFALTNHSGRRSSEDWRLILRRAGLTVEQR